MSTANLVMTKRVSSNFGAKGWGIIIASLFVCMYVVINGTFYMNFYTPAIAEARGWSYPIMLSYSTYAGFLGLILFPFVTQLTLKKGPKVTTSIALIVGAAGMYLMGNATTLGMYALSVVLCRFGLMSFLNASQGALFTNWFPFTKGLALGWATMGMNIADCAMPSLVTFLNGRIGLGGSSTVLAVAELLLALVFILFIKNTPEEAGGYPDNNPLEKDEVEANKRMIAEHVSPWTIRRLLSTPRVWQLAIAVGTMWLATVGIMGQIVPRFLDLEFSMEHAVLGISIAGFCGIFGSYFWGWLDQKIGTKRACMAFMAYYSIVYILFIISTSLPMMIICVILGGFGTGGNANLCPSMIGTIFGRLDFSAAQRVTGLVQDFFFVSSAGILSFSLLHLGGFVGSYAILLVICIIAFFLFTFLNDEFIGTPDGSYRG